MEDSRSMFDLGSSLIVTRSDVREQLVAVFRIGRRLSRMAGQLLVSPCR
jgi:hypothetical protein